MDISHAVSCIKTYLNSKSNLPFFVSADGSAEYEQLHKELLGLQIIKTSNYCADDSYPDFDKLYDDLKSLNRNAVLLGLGASAILSGDTNPLGKIKDFVLAQKLIILCRGVNSVLRQLNSTDRKFNKLRYCVVDSVYDCSVIGVSKSVSLRAFDGFKSLLNEMESGLSGKIYVKTELPVRTVYEIHDAYSAIKEHNLSFSVEQYRLTEKEWGEYLVDSNLNGYPLDHWRTYLAYLLKMPDDAYLRAVVQHSKNHIVYKSSLFSYILEIERDTKEFTEMYALRKKILADFKYADIAAYLNETYQKGNERIYYLTDNTDEERMEIIKEICKFQIIPTEISTIYPDLAKYLYSYVFSNKQTPELTSYFSEYRRLKLLNRIDDAFNNAVIALSNDGQRIFNILPSKNKLIEKYDDGRTALCWIDALGVEYLGFIQKLSLEFGLSITISIGCANLPTLTCFNKDFYDDWQGPKLKKIKELDDIKHEGINYEASDPLSAPVHIVKELQIIRNALETIKGKLLQGEDYTSILLTSDHGASRLAVISNSENKWEMKEKGKHSGRCCPISDVDSKPICASKGNDYWVLANYDRFKGGRASNVEVHGGASLEEVIVPVIKIELADTVNKPQIKNLTDNPQYTFDTDPTVILYCPYDIPLLCIKMEGKIYKGVKMSDKQYKITITNCRKARRNVTIECFNGDNYITSFDILISSKAVKTNNDDDFFS